MGFLLPLIPTIAASAASTAVGYGIGKATGIPLLGAGIGAIGSLGLGSALGGAAAGASGAAGAAAEAPKLMTSEAITKGLSPGLDSSIVSGAAQAAPATTGVLSAPDLAVKLAANPSVAAVPTPMNLADKAASAISSKIKGITDFPKNLTEIPEKLTKIPEKALKRTINQSIKDTIDGEQRAVSPQVTSEEEPEPTQGNVDALALPTTDTSAAELAQQQSLQSIFDWQKPYDSAEYEQSEPFSWQREALNRINRNR